ncbi:MAG: VOC family protein [Pirellulales bacterium]|nr:VOC family protein [Pirellulales bacterium]
MALISPNPVNWFELPVVDLPRAIKFYEQAFEVQMSPIDEVGGNKMSFFPMEMSAPGAGGSLIHLPQVQPSAMGATIYFKVASIEPVLTKIQAAGGKICMPRTSIGQYGFIAQFIDSEGSRVALHETPPGQPAG